MNKYNWEKERIEEAVKISYNKCETLRNLGIPTVGNNIETLNKKIKEFDIDTSHFTGRHYITNDVAYVPYKEYENNERKIKTFSLKQKLFKEHLKEQKCEICGITEWLGKPINLQLHHKDGNNQNNNLDNLMILCPNCHSQTDNYCGKANRKKDKSKKCPECGKPILPNSKYCPLCAASHRKKIELTKEQLIKDLEELGSKVAVAKKYGVSETTIRKRMKKLGIILK